MEDGCMPMTMSMPAPDSRYDAERGTASLAAEWAELLARHQPRRDG
jgi:hypothetical protein